MKSAALWLACVAALGCTPELDDRPYLIERARLIAVQSEPAEARPGEKVTFSPVVAGPGMPKLSFRFCNRTRPLADPRPVAEACLDDAEPPLEAAGHGARGTVPAAACARFGPDPVANDLRPADADASGGFYQPVLIDGLDEPSILLLRIHCPLPDVPAELSRDLEKRYLLNSNPRLAALEANVEGVFSSDFALHAGGALQLSVSWPETTREDYLWLPPQASRIQQRREALRVSWFTSNGTFAASTTGGEPDATATSSTNTFTADATSSSIDVWAVLQDDRGGIDAKRWRLNVKR